MSSLATEARAAPRDIAPAAIAAIPIGALFGALAAAKGLSPLEVSLMSLFVFAGGAQFAAVEIWRFPAPIAVLTFSTLLINARHVLMGASLAPKTGALRPWQKALGFAVMADENWAMMERRAQRHTLTPAYVMAMSFVFWLNWQFWTLVGALAGTFLSDPRMVGADFAFSALFIGLIAGFWKGRATGVTVAASGVAAAVTYHLAGAPWHVAAGALAGIGVACLMADPDEDASADAAALAPRAAPVGEVRS
jgi:4-azaleucine resistance transporter AzlC